MRLATGRRRNQYHLMSQSAGRVFLKDAPLLAARQNPGPVECLMRKSDGSSPTPERRVVPHLRRSSKWGPQIRSSI